MQNDGDRFLGLPLCALSSGALHGLGVVALLPMILLPGSSGGGTQREAVTIEVEVITASLPSAPSPRREESGVEAASQDPDMESAAQTDPVAALPDPIQENELLAPEGLAAEQGGESAPLTPEPSPHSASIEQADAAPSDSAEIEIGVPADAAKLEATSTGATVTDTAKPDATGGAEPEPKMASVKEETGNLSPAKPSTSAKPAVAKPKPAARPARAQRTVVRSPGKTTGLQNFFQNLGNGRPRPVQARGRSGTGGKSAPSSKGNNANPLYFR